MNEELTPRPRLVHGTLEPAGYDPDGPCCPGADYWPRPSNYLTPEEIERLRQYLVQDPAIEYAKLMEASREAGKRLGQRMEAKVFEALLGKEFPPQTNGDSWARGTTKAQDIVDAVNLHSRWLDASRDYVNPLEELYSSGAYDDPIPFRSYYNPSPILSVPKFILTTGFYDGPFSTQKQEDFYNKLLAPPTYDHFVLSLQGSTMSLSQTPRIYVDLDGVLANFHRGSLQRVGQQSLSLLRRIIENVSGLKHLYQRMPVGLNHDQHVLNTVDFLLQYWPKGHYSISELLGISEEQFWAMLGPDIFNQLPPFPQNQKLLELVSQIDPNFQICTHPGPLAKAVSSKEVWLENHYPQLLTRTIFIREKWRLASSYPVCILIDDMDANLQSWVNSGGYGVLMPRLWNSGHRWHNATIEHVTEELTRILERADGDGYNLYRRNREWASAERPVGPAVALPGIGPVRLFDHLTPSENEAWASTTKVAPATRCPECGKMSIGPYCRNPTCPLPKEASELPATSINEEFLQNEKTFSSSSEASNADSSTRPEDSPTGSSAGSDLPPVSPSSSS